MSAKKEQRQIRRYSDAFKRQVVESIEEGSYTKAEAVRQYGCSHSSIRRWLKKLGKNHLVNKVVRIQTMDEPERIQELADQVEKLKAALADAHMEQVVAENHLEIACRQLGEEPEEFKKKHGQELSR